jgi:hypothetical protein
MTEVRLRKADHLLLPPFRRALRRFDIEDGHS